MDDGEDVPWDDDLNLQNQQMRQMLIDEGKEMGMMDDVGDVVVMFIVDLVVTKR